jgi:hypothetical protein
MSKVRFNHVFVALMLLSVAAAFIIPPKYTTAAQPQLQALFAPVSRPARAAAGWADVRLFPPKSHDDRSATDVKAENAALRARIAQLETTVDILAQRKAQREKLGPVGEFTDTFKVAGNDSATRDSLAVQGSSLEGLRAGMHVLYPDGVVGTIQPGRAGMAGAQVRLVTDIGFRVLGQFGSFRKGGDGTADKPGFVPSGTPAVLVEGMGQGAMVVRQLTMEQVAEAGLKAGRDQWVVLADTDWPDNLRGLQLGYVARIDPRRDAPLFAEIRIEPEKDLLKLREVMVVTKE